MSLEFLALSDEKWSRFVKAIEPLPELLTNHSDLDALHKLYIF